jgi:hypothetical protein
LAAANAASSSVSKRCSMARLVALFSSASSAFEPGDVRLDDPLH